MPGADIEFYWAVAYEHEPQFYSDFPECGTCDEDDNDTHLADFEETVGVTLDQGMHVVITDFETNGYKNGTHTDFYDHTILLIGYRVGRDHSIHYNGACAVPDVPQETRDAMKRFLERRGITRIPLLYQYVVSE